MTELIGHHAKSQFENAVHLKTDNISVFLERPKQEESIMLHATRLYTVVASITLSTL